MVRPATVEFLSEEKYLCKRELKIFCRKDLEAGTCDARAKTDME